MEGFSRMTEHIICISPLWTFLNPAEIIHIFQARNDGLVTKCEFSESAKQFIIKCQLSQHDLVINVFLQTLRDYIGRETLNAPTSIGDPFEHPQAVRPPETGVQKVHEYFDQANRFDEHEQSHDIGTTSGELISHETLFRQWKPEATENLARTLFSPAVIDDVARGTSCRVEWRKEALAILGDDQHEVDIVLTSLKDIEISHLQTTNQRLDFDFYYCKGQTGLKFRFITPRNIVDQSLLSRDTFLFSLYELALVFWDSSSSQYRQVVRTPSAIHIPDDRYNPWAEEVRLMYGEERNDPKHWFSQESAHVGLGPLIGLPMDGMKRVSQWAHGIDKESVSPSSARELDTQQPENETKGYVRTKVKLKDLQPSAEPLSQQPKLPDLLPRACTTHSEAHLKILSDGIVNKLSPEHSHAAPSLIKTPKIEVFPMSDLINTSAGQYRALDGSHDQEDPAISIPSSVPQMHLEKFSEKARSASPWSSSNLVINDKHRTNERLGSDDEDATRDYRTQYNLKSGRSAVREPIRGPLHLIQEAVLKIFRASQVPNKVRVNLELLLGKLFVEAMTVPLDYRCHRKRPALAFAPVDWSAIMPTLNGTGSTSTIFSRRITRSWEDARFLLDLPHPTMRRMFKPAHQSMRAYYEIDCLESRTGTELIIEIADNKEVLMRAPESKVGTVSLHFPERAWDARFVVSSTSKLDSKSARSLTSLVDKLWINAPDGSEGEAPERLYCQKEGSHVIIRSVKLKREITHEITETKSDVSLYMTQVKRLQVTEYPGNKFCAWAFPEEEMVLQGLLWWEAQLSVNNAIHEMQEDQAYDDSLMRYAIQRLYDIARQVIASMDNIGCTSQMPTESSSLNYSLSQRNRTQSSNMGASQEDS